MPNITENPPLKSTPDSILAALARTRKEARWLSSSYEPDSGVFRLFAGLGLILRHIETGRPARFPDLIRWLDTLADSEQEAGR